MEQTARPLPASPPPIVLSFAASDPSGGAGVQADLLTLAANGCHPLSVLTAITVQDTVGVEAVLPVDADWVEQQARTLLADMPVAAFKIGLPGSADNIAVIAAILADYPDIPVVLDPVLASGRGDKLANAAAIGALRELLLPRVSVLTPNSIEARGLLADDQEFLRRHGDSGDAGEPSLADCAARLIALGCRTVLVTGTHENTAQVVNTLYDASGCLRRDVWERLPGEYHGSGCTLASAIAAGLAHGLPLAEAVRAGQDYTWRTLAAGFRAGRGQFIPDRFFDRFCDHAAQQRSSNA
ncbi:bifunctional hydroxymethylpyrimidine kinase/phosphomethylpyrimidine kinase [Rhodocyclus tenuis]|uniref:bifunctional hydroxymethylpyrimidine kinase/phosphomethylpyrimidine kinase n=1 Tax=Rhodocyclus tenuis TaxID=1066 RepID=UPI00190346C4|nr:hydroxymethylpyrimidine/phosphomethylpyrimidine kinase [Rhodocyclus tenuis]MBK1681904.1 hydroxymethylpyrimidine/phosphomethylpyrimidine kinase [Rhodocyclus tenuis]